LIRCREELEQKAARPILVARSQSPEVLPPVRLGNPVPAGPKPPPTPTETTAPAPDIRLPDLTPTAPSSPAPVTPAAGTGPAGAPVTAAAAVPKLEGDAQVRIVASIGN